jgi:predicted MFS family arabinose efflux permease
LIVSHSGLFVGNALAFLISAALIVSTALPKGAAPERVGGLTQQITFGLRSYWKTPRLRALLMLYLAVAAASSMVIVNTVVYVRQDLGLGEAEVALGLAAAGAGSMLTAIGLPKLLERVAERPLMLGGGVAMMLGLAAFAELASFPGLLLSWFAVGVGWSLVQTPSGRLVNRSAAPGDRAAYFSAQFALSHLCWLVFYPVTGYLGARWGVEATALFAAGAAGAFTLVSAVSWPKLDSAVLDHTHESVSHTHWHLHDEHHQHDHTHEEAVGLEPHRHPHRHAPLTHTHPFVIDDHHTRWPRSST